jgi:hypothetical protein
MRAASRAAVLRLHCLAPRPPRHRAPLSGLGDGGNCSGEVKPRVGVDLASRRAGAESMEGPSSQPPASLESSGYPPAGAAASCILVGCMMVGCMIRHMRALQCSSIYKGMPLPVTGCLKGKKLNLGSVGKGGYWLSWKGWILASSVSTRKI